MTLHVSEAALVYLVGLLATAVYFDFRYRRIPNALTFGGALAGLLLVVRADPDWQTLALSAGGGVFGLLLFLPSYAIGKMGAGDVKLLGMVGVFVGPGGVLWAAAWSVIAGGALALLWLLGTWGVRGFALRTLGTLTAVRLSGSTPRDSGARGSAMKSKMPYAAAIAVGAVASTRVQIV